MADIDRIVIGDARRRCRCAFAMWPKSRSARNCARGAGTYNGHEAVVGTTFMLMGENSPHGLRTASRSG